MRTWIAVVLSSIFLASFSPQLAAQNNPVPFVHNPLVPAVTAPGGPGFTVTVNGAEFVNGAVVNWNGSPRMTTFLSPIKLTAAILASDIATAGTVFVTVSNPTPGGGTSNPAFFEVTTSTSSLAFTRTDTIFPTLGSSTINDPSALTVLDPTNTGAPYLAVANGKCPTELECLMEKASITIAVDGSDVSSQPFTGESPDVIGSGDFNGDGYPDLITFGGYDYSILLNEPKAGIQFTPHADYPLPSGCNFPFAFGDFNSDGHLDLIMSGTGVCVLLGNGDGTFGTPAIYDSGILSEVLAAGDFNGDGKLDLAVANTIAGSISILLGNGDGTFQSPIDTSSDPFPNFAVAGDFNGDGKLDLAVGNSTTVSIFLGNGDGTFQPKVDYPAGTSIQSLTIGDYNGDGVLDLAVADSLCSPSCPANGSVNVLLGNGDGTFQSSLNFATGGQPVSITTGELADMDIQGGPVGRVGFATANQANSTVSVFTAIPTGAINPLPTISSISPASALLDSGAFTLTVDGTNFISGATVSFGGQPRATTFVSATELTAAIEAGDVGSIGSVSVVVTNPTPGGGGSAQAQFIVYGPPPTVTTLDPTSVVAGGPAFTLTVNGSNFLNGATVNFNGTPRITTFVSATQLTIPIAVGDIANQGTINISVTNPTINGFGGGTTSALPLTILPTNTQPVVGGLSPASATAGGPGFTLTLAGSGFTASSVVKFNSSVVSSAFVSATELQASIPASAIAVAGTPFVTVANPGGNPSVVVTFTINNPVPGASSLSPSSLPAGNAAATLSVTGSNFNSGSIVQVGGSSRTTTFVSSTTLTAALPASDFAHSGTLNITVNNPAPGGGTTSALTFTVEDFNLSLQTPAPPVTAGQPASYSLMVVPTNSTITSPVSLMASGLPTGTSASFSPSATIPTGSATTTVMLSITTTPHSAASAVGSTRGTSDWPHLLSLQWIVSVIVLIFIGQFLALHGRPKRLVPQLLLGLLLVVIAGMVACGGGASSGTQLNPETGTPAGTYQILVSATSGSGSLSTTVTLTVM